MCSLSYFVVAYRSSTPFLVTAKMQISGQKKKKAERSTPPPATGQAGGWGSDKAADVTFEPGVVGVDDRTGPAPKPQAPRSGDVTDSHIKLLEPEMIAATSIPFAALKEEPFKVKAMLDDIGFAVVTDVLSAVEVQAMEQLFAADLTGIVETKLHPNSKELAFLKDPVHQWPQQEEFSLGTKFATMYGLPQGQLAWACRTHPNVKAVYEAIYSTDALCCGMDNVFYNPNRCKTSTDSERSSNLWPHADQNAHLQPEGKYDVYQSVVYIWPADLDTSATVVWPSSNQQYFQRLMNYTNARGHFCMMPKSEFGVFAEGARRIPVPAGGMLLWSSKTIHQGWPCGPRLAVPVCFEPKSRRTEAALQRKIQCVQFGHPTTHWASLGKSHSMSSQCTGVDGGTQAVTLKHRAHKHCLDAQGNVLPHILAYL